MVLSGDVVVMNLLVLVILVLLHKHIIFIEISPGTLVCLSRAKEKQIQNGRCVWSVYEVDFQKSPEQKVFITC